MHIILSLSLSKYIEGFVNWCKSIWNKNQSGVTYRWRYEDNCL